MAKILCRCLSVVVLQGLVGLALATTQSGHQEATVVLVRDVTSQYQEGLREFDGSADAGDIQLEVHGDGQPLTLHLKENRGLRVPAPAYVLRRNLHFNLQPVRIPDKKHVLTTRFYQDVTNGAAVSVECSRGRKPCQRTVSGTLYIEGKQYRIEPAQVEIQHASRVLDSTSLTSHVLHAMRERTGKLDDIRRNLPDESHQDKLRSNVESTLSKLLRALRIREKRATKPVYQVGLLVVADYSLYKLWLDRSTATDKDADAKKKIQTYMHYIVNGMDLRFQNMDASDFAIEIRLSAIYISDTEENSPWTSGIADPGTPHCLVDADLALDEFTTFYQNHTSPPDLPADSFKVDHAMLMTACDIYGRSEDGVDKSTVGLAGFETMCSPKSTSINEDNGFHEGVATSAHELGHSLGMNHDGGSAQHKCKDESYFIMAALGGTPAQIDKLNPWKFSTCSVEDVRKFLKKLNDENKNCLKDAAVNVSPEEWKNVKEHHPGQIYNADQQCGLLTGDKTSKVCDTSLAGICTTMKCNMAGTCSYENEYKAARGTMCGTDKWCINGKCVGASGKSASTGTTSSSGDGVTEPTNSCTDAGYEDEYRLWTCEDLLESYDYSFDDMCADFQAECCDTCSIHSCTDDGYENAEFGWFFTCDVLLGSYNTVDDMCTDFKEECCATCKPTV